MLAAHHRPNNPTGKRLGLPHSHFEKTQLTDSTIYNVQPLKNRRFSSPVAKDGLVGRDAALRRPRPRAAGGTLRGPRWLGHVEAPLHAARTAQRAVPTTVNRFCGRGSGETNWWTYRQCD